MIKKKYLFIQNNQTKFTIILIVTFPVFIMLFILVFILS